jgi:dipeptidyl aminopeptidase/acylaminoacyl peptidase
MPHKQHQRQVLAWVLSVLFALLPLASPAIFNAQGAREDYRRAERFLAPGLRPLVFEGQVTPNWIEQSSRFWYRNDKFETKEFIVVDAAQNMRGPAFDHEKLAAALSRATGKSYQARALPFDAIAFTEGSRAVEFDVERARWVCNLTAYECKPGQASRPIQGTGQRGGGRGQGPGQQSPPRLDVPSPDGKYTALVKNHNLYVRVVATGEEIQLSRDGEPHYDYATPLPSTILMVQQGTENPAQPAAVFWSPDSKKLATYLLDQRGFPRLTMVQAAPPNDFRPRGFHYAYPLPVDEKLPTAKPVIFDIEQRKQIPVESRPINVLYYGGPNFTWFADGQRLHYRETERGYRNVYFREVDAATGKSRAIVEEHAETQISSSMIRLINKESEVIWSSERDGWQHLYLYDVKTGRLKNQITKGEWVVRGIEHVDEQNRQLYFTAGGRETGRDPYLRHLYRSNLDGSGLKLLTPEEADHTVSFSPDGKFFVDAYSRVDLPTVSVLRRAEDGSVVRELERADVSKLLATGWKFPEPFKAKARDGKTDIYGLIWRPSNFDPSKKYPVIEQIYTGPQSSFVPKTFAAFRNQSQVIAELGFICVFIDGQGTWNRSKAFHDFAYKNLGDGGIDDHIAAMRQMAARYPYMDLTRVGIWGHSAGGYDSTHAILKHPDFYKVAVSSAGNHDHRMDKATWNERWMGTPVGEHYIQQSNYTMAPNLKGKLLLAHGDLDENVPIAATIKLVDALIKANKDFDLIVMPNRNHGFGNDPYFMRRRWDFFVKHLLGVNPPEGYQIGGETGTRPASSN